MYFRENKTKVQCLRAVYDPKRKRSVNKMIATQNKHLAEVSADVAERLEPNEVEELQRYLDDRRAARDKAMQEYQAKGIGLRLSDAVKAIEVGHGEAMSPDEVQAAYDGMKALRKALREAGFKDQNRGKK